VQSEPLEFHGAHEHGKVLINVALDGRKLSAELNAPAKHVVGFEHAPRNAAEQERLRKVEAWLRTGQKALGVPAAANCRVLTAEVELPRWASKNGQDKNADHHSAGHADYRVRWSYECANPSALTWIEAWALNELLDKPTAVVNFVSPRQQTSGSVQDARARIVVR
jgi:hypothetical protein